MTAWFTKEELDGLSITQLLAVADYFQIKYVKPITLGKRQKIISAILKSWEGDAEVNVSNVDDGVARSVQVQRIYDSLKEKK